MKQASQAVARLILDNTLSNPPKTSEILSLLMQAEEAGYQRGLAAPRPKPQKFGSESCTVCGVEWVDAAAGFDTCAGCLRELAGAGSI